MYSYDKKFYKKYGIKVTDDPKLGLTDEEADAFEDSHYIISSKRGTRADIHTLKDYIRQFPHNPSFKNHLSVLYGQLDMLVEKKKITLEIINRHPDYMLGRTSLAEISIEEGNLELAKKMLGETRNINALRPGEDAVFHYSEFLSYYAVAGMYEMEIDDRKAAEDHLELMIEYDPEHPTCITLARYITSAGFKNLQKRVEADQAIGVTVNSFPTYTPEPTDIPPKLHHEELEAFYLYSENELPEEIKTDIMQLPRETLIADLETILEDGVRRNNYFQEKYTEEYNVSELSFMTHAAYFLGALEAKESLHSLLNVLRQGEEFADFWFGDFYQGSFEEPLFLIAKDQVEKLKDYALEPNQYYYSRIIALAVLTQIGLHFPERRDEIIGYFKEMSEYHLTRPDDKTIIDTEFLTHLVGYPTPFREPSLLEYAKKIDERKWLGYMMYGNLEQIEKDTHKLPEAADLEPMPQDIYEFYNGKHNERKAKYSYFKDLDLLEPPSKAARYVSEVMIGKRTYKTTQSQGEYYDDDEYTPSRHEYQEPVVNTSPKIGRNDPCPCGSGKKYKKCCIKKAG